MEISNQWLWQDIRLRLETEELNGISGELKVDSRQLQTLVGQGRNGTHSRTRQPESTLLGHCPAEQVRGPFYGWTADPKGIVLPEGSLQLVN